MTPNTFKLPAVWAIPVLLAFFFPGRRVGMGCIIKQFSDPTTLEQCRFSPDSVKIILPPCPFNRP